MSSWGKWFDAMNEDDFKLAQKAMIDSVKAREEEMLKAENLFKDDVEKLGEVFDSLQSNPYFDRERDDHADFETRLHDIVHDFTPDFKKAKIDSAIVCEEVIESIHSIRAKLDLLGVSSRALDNFLLLMEKKLATLREQQSDGAE